MTDVICASPTEAVATLAADLIAATSAAQAEGRVAQLCITGGRAPLELYRLLADKYADAVDWRAVELWWVDERYVPSDSADRNAEPALELLAGLPLDPSRVHPMPADEGADLNTAAAGYAELVGDTVFDVCLLGMGPDGHCASLFPGHPEARTEGTAAIAVHDSPKPPPKRISLTMEVINRSAEKFLLVTGADKAEACARAHAEAGPDSELPVARVTDPVWYLEADSASRLS